MIINQTKNENIEKIHRARVPAGDQHYDQSPVSGLMINYKNDPVRFFKDLFHIVTQCVCLKG